MNITADWQVEALRITVFPSDIEGVSSQKLWDLLMFEEPDEIHVQKGQIDAREVKYGNGRMILSKQTDRVDWRYLSIPDENIDSAHLPIIGSLDEELKTFVKLVNKWFDTPDMISIKRLAFGAVLLCPVNTVEEGNSVLGGLLHNINLKNAREFNYQVNRRRKSVVDPEVEINRLNKWNVYSGQLVSVSVNSMQAPQIIASSDLRIASRLELDINTFQERTESLPPDTLKALFNELVEWGLEISKKGDIE